MTFKAPAHRSHGSTGLARPAADYRKRGEDSATANEYGRIHAGSQSLVTLESLVQGPGRAGPCIEPPQQHGKIVCAYSPTGPLVESGPLSGPFPSVR